jgi:hypothetical protein
VLHHQYIVNVVIGALLLLLQCRQRGQLGFYGASIAVDPESLVTAWLIGSWLAMAVKGFRRAHGFLTGFFNLAEIHIAYKTKVWEQAAGYLIENRRSALKAFASEAR